MKKHLPALAASLALLIGAISEGDFPHGSYQLLRIGVTACAIWLLLGRQWKKPDWKTIGREKYILIPIAVLFNPLVPLEFDES